MKTFRNSGRSGAYVEDDLILGISMGNYKDECSRVSRKLKNNKAPEHLKCPGAINQK
jgi:hypothetical protein